MYSFLVEGGAEETSLSLFPMHNIQSSILSTVVFFGTEDKGVNVESAKLYKQKMEKFGNCCDLFLYIGQQHEFFNYRENSTNCNK